MEDHQLASAAASATPVSELSEQQQQQPKKQMVVADQAPVPAEAAAAAGSTNAAGGDNDCSPPTASALLGGPRRAGLHLFVMNVRHALKLDDLGSEVLRIAVPASLALTADPLASLIDTAFIGRIGFVEIAAVGVSIAVFNQVMKVCIYPLVSVTTSFVAEEDSILSKADAVAGEDEVNNAKGHSHTTSAVADLEKQQAPSSGQKVGADPAEANVDKAAAVSASGAGVLGGRSRRRRFIPSVTYALMVGAFLGLLQAAAARHGRQAGFTDADAGIALLGSEICRCSGRATVSGYARRFQRIQGHQNTLYATVVGDVANIVLDPILIFTCRLGVVGAAIAHVISQYLITLIMLCKLVRMVDVVPCSLKSLKFGRFLGCGMIFKSKRVVVEEAETFTGGDPLSGLLLLARVVAVTFCVTLAASLAARHGATAMAAFQICSQVWLATSLLADGLAVAAQALLATSFAKKDHYKVAVTTARVLQLGIVFGVGLTGFLAVGLLFGAGVFTKDAAVVRTIHKGVPVRF
ncbi:hypothetical protein GUJ93_ZPchr0019g2660 [Zizania palustris]|uniref:Protein DETOXIFICATION n=1 Tax=Zizania palustris TaxID=103762 RepID=A0A8J5TFJ5_ZIZPA|nr:hypothetical protein GUJ93_ZPchr0019g2660 [Zizania palustris]KAG8081669.1 hypothetical protein GUJ93_ZPchr0019g2660 [Zizania palustris]